MFDDAGIGTQTDAPNPDAACGLVTEQAETNPVRVVLLLDKSSSMVGSKWDASKAALSAFVHDADSAGLFVGLRLFPADGAPTCDYNVYKQMNVEIAELPGNADAIDQAMSDAAPDGFSTPVYPAFNGALLKAIEEADNHPGHRGVVLLVTDGAPAGQPTVCSGNNALDFQVIADAAATAYDNFDVATFVIGLPGADQSFANLVASAGGTESAILISTANVQGEFQDALSKVRGQALPCDYAIPEKVKGGEIDPTDVNVLLTFAGQETATLPQNKSCNGKGWHYDNAANPTKILLCPDSCAAVKEDFNAKIQILLGCKTEVVE